MLRLPDNWSVCAGGPVAMQLLRQVRGKRKQNEFIHSLIGASLDVMAYEPSARRDCSLDVKVLPNMTWKVGDEYFVYLSAPFGRAEQACVDLARTSSVTVVTPDNRKEGIMQSLDMILGCRSPTVLSLPLLISWRLLMTSIDCHWSRRVVTFELYSYFNRRVIASEASRSLLIDLTPIEAAMTDQFTKPERSRIMAAVKSKNTTPEMVVRRMVHGMGYRYRLHVAALPGRPDIVLPRLRKIIVVNGCFWHLHRCKHCRVPNSSKNYWTKKLGGNAARDKRNRAALRRAGWKVLVVWECQTQPKSMDALRAKIAAFLASPD